ncbi:MAG: helix-turn-helix domain-containing protein [Parcubacteria group bacterium]
MRNQLKNNKLQLYKTRDRRSKERFYVDDVYLNEYARHLGPTATVVYMSLCRHANKQDESWPAQERIAEQHGFKSRRTVIRAISDLLSWNIIQVEKEKSERGEFLHNVYVLLDKSQWKPLPMRHQSHTEEPCDTRVTRETHVTSECKTMRHQSHMKESHKKESHTNVSKADGPFSFEDYLTQMEKDKRTHIPVIASYWRIKGFSFKTKAQAESALRRELRPAKALVPYEQLKVAKVLTWLRDNADFKWTLETAHKYIDEDLNELSKKQRKMSGEFQCQFGFWHKKFEQCGHTLEDAKQLLKTA